MIWYEPFLVLLIVIALRFEIVVVLTVRRRPFLVVVSVTLNSYRMLRLAACDREVLEDGPWVAVVGASVNVCAMMRRVLRFTVTSGGVSSLVLDPSAGDGIENSVAKISTAPDAVEGEVRLVADDSKAVVKASPFSDLAVSAGLKLVPSAASPNAPVLSRVIFPVSKSLT